MEDDDAVSDNTAVRFTGFGRFFGYSGHRALSPADRCQSLHTTEDKNYVRRWPNASQAPQRMVLLTGRGLLGMAAGASPVESSVDPV